MNGRGDGYVSREAMGMRWQVHECYLDHFPPQVSMDPNEAAPNARVLQVKSGRSAQLISDGHAGGDIVIKRYVPRVWIEYVKYCLKRSRASAEWHTNHALTRIGVSCPRILALGERRRMGIWRGSILVMEAVPFRMTLYDYLKDRVGGAQEAGLIHDLARSVARLHETDFYYQDLHGENILVSVEPDKSPRFFFIDLHEVRYVGQIQRRMCIDDLARLNGYIVTRRRNRIAFLKTYLQERTLPAADHKAWARDIDRRTREIWDRFYRKRGRRIDTY